MNKKQSSKKRQAMRKVAFYTFLFIFSMALTFSKKDENKISQEESYSPSEKGIVGLNEKNQCIDDF